MELSAHRAKISKFSKEQLAKQLATTEASTQTEFVWPVSKAAINAQELPPALKVAKDIFWLMEV
jgi:hypothetical protein